MYDGDLPALDGPAGSWFLAPGQQPDPDRLAKLAASLGVTGDVRSLPDEQGGGWAVGPEDYSGPVLTVDGRWLTELVSERGADRDQPALRAPERRSSCPSVAPNVGGSSGTATDPATPDDRRPLQ